MEALGRLVGQRLDFTHATPFFINCVSPICERFLGSVRRECLDHVLILSERHLVWVLRTYTAYFNAARPHQDIGQSIPEPAVVGSPLSSVDAPVRARPVLGGLHHDYHRVA